jgi:transcriptional regulator with XRE-family HTH domain
MVNILKLRADLGRLNGLKKPVSQADLAKRLGISQVGVSRIQNGAEPSKPVQLLLDNLLAEVSARRRRRAGGSGTRAHEARP